MIGKNFCLFSINLRYAKTVDLVLDLWSTQKAGMDHALPGEVIYKAQSAKQLSKIYNLVEGELLRWTILL